MKRALLVALYHASVALHVPLPINEFKESNTLLKQMPIYKENKISSTIENRGIFEEETILGDPKEQDYIDYNINADPFLVSPWPSKEIPYIILTGHFNYFQVRAIEDAIQEINRISCLYFQRISEDSTINAIVITGDGDGCYSSVGYQNTMHIINLSNLYEIGFGCFRHGSILHEILHALGFHHTHSRVDRDKYVDIIWNNIQQDNLYGFLMQVTPRGIDLVTSYDYNSCMHYGRKAFSRTGEDTIVPKQVGVRIGQREGLSQGDIERLNLMYCT